VTHEELCERAVLWLSGKRCNPIFCRIASATEIPDAIGWSSKWNWQGSIVIECKVSVGDFRGDIYKRFPTAFPDKDCAICDGIGFERGKRRVVCLCRKPMKMGDRRYFMVPTGLINLEDMAKYPDHGLLWVKGRRVVVMKEAPERTERNTDNEIRLLRFAIINRKKNLSSNARSLDFARDDRVAEVVHG
jgi:hypothetical protein